MFNNFLKHTHKFLPNWKFIRDDDDECEKEERISFKLLDLHINIRCEGLHAENTHYKQLLL